MTRETRIGLVVGLLFIVMFALVLSELTGKDGTPAPACGQADGREGPWVEQAGAPRIPSSTPPFPPGVAEPVAPRPSTPIALTARRPLPAPSRAVPAPAPRPTPARALPRVAPARQHMVRQGDRLIDIAKQYYGASNGHLYTYIYQANRRLLDEAGTLQPGQILTIPTLVERGPEAPRGGAAVPARRGASIRLPADAARPRTYRVRRGDNLTDIARRVLHDGSHAAVQRIISANRARLSDPDVLPVGLELVIPS